MRRPLIVLPALLGLFAAIGCEDGPNDAYQPAPTSAGSVWNGQGDAGPGVAVADGAQSLDSAYPTTNAVSLCSTDFKRQRWAWMLEQPITPPRGYAGIDLAKSDNWEGLRIEEAEKPPVNPTDPTGGLCQSTPLGFEGGCPSGIGACNAAQWGNNGEVSISWNVATHLIDQMVMALGYTGGFKTNPYPDHNGEVHSYSMQIGDVIRRDGAAFLIDWNTDPSIAITDIFNAAMATYAPKAAVGFDTTPCTDDAQCTAPGAYSCQCKHVKGSTKCDPTSTKGQCGFTNCGADSNCAILPNSGGVNIFGFRPLVFYVEGTAGVAQPALSTPIAFYNFFSKTEPYSNLPQQVKLDQDGPIAKGKPSGQPAGGSKICTQQIGQTFGDLKTNCIQVHGDATDPKGVDQVNLNKVLNGLSHDEEHYTANVLGVNQNFTAMSTITDPTHVITDSEKPVDADIAQDWTFDVRARGAVANDYAKGVSPPKLDFRGSALVMAEWGRLMLADAARQLGLAKPKVIGDPSCTGYDTTGAPNYQSSTGCTGLEGIIIPRPSGNIVGSGTYDPTPNYDQIGVYTKSILKPGDVVGGFCIDSTTNQSDCTTGYSVFANAHRHVIRVLGRGNVNALPSEMQDRRYYFRLFGQAYVKYLRAYGKHDPATRDNFATAGGVSLDEVDATDFDAESLFFDYEVQPGAGGAQTFDKFEYIERDYNGKGAGGTFNTVPWDFEYGIDLLAGNQRYQNFYRRMDREETAMYSVMLEDKSHNPGDENNVNITNLFGSDLLAGVWPSYLCAIGQGGDPTANCLSPADGRTPVNPPLDPVAIAADPCDSSGACAKPKEVCGGGPSYESGFVSGCGPACDFKKFPASGCSDPSQACAAGACLAMKFDRNGSKSKYGRPLLARYPGAFATTPFHKGHSPITLAAADKNPGLGVAKITIPNFAAGPYTTPFQFPDATGACPTGYTIGTSGAFCLANLSAGTGSKSPSFTPITPWEEVQPAVGFDIFLDAQHTQHYTTGELDFRGVLETYAVQYVPYIDPGTPTCISTGDPTDPTKGCAKGFNCDPVSHACVTTDNTIRIAAITGADFLGQAFVCQDPATSDILHVGMYDSAISVVQWLANHPGSQTACNILVVRSPYDNYVDFIASLGYGVNLDVAGGQGQGRIVNIAMYDTSLPLTP